MSVLIVLGFIVIFILATLLNGIALVKLWDWFVVPIFNIQSLTIVQAIGLSILINFMTSQYTEQDNKNKEKEMLIKRCVYAIVYPLIAMGIGWIVYQFV